MEIKTIGQLRKVIDHLDDDFRLEIRIMTEIPKEELVKSMYPYPWRHEDGKLEFHDIGYSDKVICFGVHKE